MIKIPFSVFDFRQKMCFFRIYCELDVSGLMKVSLLILLPY